MVAEELLVNALAECFTWDELRMLVSFQFGEALENITKNDRGLRVVAFDLVKWSSRRGKRRELFDAAAKANPVVELVRLSDVLKSDAFDGRYIACNNCGAKFFAS